MNLSKIAYPPKELPVVVWIAVLECYVNLSDGGGKEFMPADTIEIPFMLNAEPTAHARNIADLVLVYGYTAPGAERETVRYYDRVDLRAIAYDGPVC